MRTRRQRLALRGAGASFAANLIAAVSHTLGGEDAPAPLLVLAMMALLWAPSMALMGQRPRAGRIGTTVIAAQAAFHAVYATLGFPTGGGYGPSGHAGHGAPLELGPLGPAVEVSPLMVASHAAAAVVSFVVLLFGERALRAILEWTEASLRARLTAPRLRVPSRPAVVAARPRAPRSGRVFALIGPRGPPLPSL
ncbi:hypothetical protein [Microbacterium sp. Marseille-Q6965]|uniref:hypothetical protein n=1 Tax=Microbacterium sp. Marseille-Q6965 TaxID=2965072 RepID=UPI0021B7808B|nr:hypothetical protein [Microbacterium sp. Marseille-Q6965]